MTDPHTQTQVDAEQIRLVREALALRRERPTGENTAPALRFFPGGPRPTLAEAGERRTEAPTPAAQEPRALYRRSRRAGGRQEGAKPALG